jgi:hypothetical protein
MQQALKCQNAMEPMSAIEGLTRALQEVATTATCSPASTDASMLHCCYAHYAEQLPATCL